MKIILWIVIIIAALLIVPQILHPDTVRDIRNYIGGIINPNIEKINLTTWKDFGDIEDFNWTLDYDESISTWIFDYNDSSGELESGRLFVYWESPDKGKITICDVSSSLSEDTLICNVEGYDKRIYAKTYLNRK